MLVKLKALEVGVSYLFRARTQIREEIHSCTYSVNDAFINI